VKQQQEISNIHKVLIDGKGKYAGQLAGLTGNFKRAIFSEEASQ
jgi:hypothetical protein